MLTIGLLTIILLSSNNSYSTKEYKNIIYISILIILYIIIILYNSTSVSLINNGLLIWNSNLLITLQNIIIKYLLCILTIIYLIILYSYLNIYKTSNYLKEYILLILFNILAVMLFIDSINSLIIFITIELQSYSLYLITSTFYKNTKSINIYSSKNGLIYFLLGSLASIIILFGLTILYNNTGLINLLEINSLYLYNINNNNITYIIGMLFILIGLFFKMGLSPLHNWLINIYSNTPTIVTLWISIIPKISILTFISSLNYILSYSNENIKWFNYIIQIIIILSMIIGGLGGLPQFNIKRILAYSGLVNSGYMLFAIWSNNQYSTYSYLFYIIQYSLTHFNIFMGLLFIIIYYNNWLIYKRNNWKLNNSNNINNTNMINNYTHSLYLNDIINLLSYNKMLGIIIIVNLTSFIGLPPLIGFFGKYYILITGLLSGYWLTVLILIIISMITAYYYGYIIKSIFTISNNNNDYNISIDEKSPNYIYSYTLSLINLCILFPILFLDIYQNGIIIINYYSII